MSQRKKAMRIIDGALIGFTMMLVLAVLEVAITPLLNPDGAIDEQSKTLIVKYRPMTKEPDDE